MAQVLVNVFDAFDEAQLAREALLAEGFDAATLSLETINDEAGPVQGNFTVGNSPVESTHHTYDRNYAVIRQAGQCMLSVAAPDASTAATAAAILARHGGRNADPAARA